MLIGAATGESIHFFAAEKTMRVQLLWAFIPYWLLVVCTSLTGAVTLHKFTDKMGAKYGRSNTVIKIIRDA